MDLPKKSSGLGANTSKTNSLYSDPAAFGPKQKLTDESADWEKIRLEITGGLAKSWLNLEPTEETVAVRKALGDIGVEHENYRAGLDLDINSLGEPQNLNESPLAQQILSYLAGKVSVSYRHGLAQISNNLFVDLNEIQGAPQVSIEGGPADQTWFAPWNTNYGSRVGVNLQVFKKENNTETAVFFVSGLIGTRAPIWRDGRLLDEDVRFRTFLLPELAARLLYIAETPLPSSIANMPRKLAYGDVPESLWPVPFYSLQDFRLTTSYFDDDKGNVQMNLHIFPQVVDFGWQITSTNSEVIDSQVSTVVDSLVRLSSILEDGFCNYQDGDIPSGWPEYFGSIDDLETGWSRALSARWIPNTQIGYLAQQCITGYVLADAEKNWDGLRWIAEYGAGASVAGAVNSLAYGNLMPQRKDEEAIGYLMAAINIDHIDESTNAMANLGQVYLAMGDTDQAEAILLSAIDRSDRYAEGEASLVLGKIYLSQQKEDLARSYLERAVASGDEEFGPDAQKILDQLSSPANPSGQVQGREHSPGAKFCADCGTQFLSQDQKFCGGCGAKRL